MITACKNYITDNNELTIWEQPYDVLSVKCTHLIQLNTEYQRCFNRIKENIEKNKDEKQFDFSETYIFGKINSFACRLEKILEMMMTLKRFEALEQSRIEGIDMLNAKFQFLTSTMEKKTYDYLDYRKLEFDSDFEEFKRSVVELEVSIRKQKPVVRRWIKMINPL